MVKVVGGFVPLSGAGLLLVVEVTRGSMEVAVVLFAVLADTSNGYSVSAQ